MYNQVYLEINTLINKKKLNINNNKLNNLLNPVNNLITDIINKKSLLDIYNNEKLLENNYDYLLNLNNKKLNFDLTFKYIHKNNEILIRNTRKSILNYFNFDLKSFSNSSSPVQVMYKTNINKTSTKQKLRLNLLNNNLLHIYKNNKTPIIINYLKEMSKFNLNRKGIFIMYNKLIGYNFNNYNNKLIKNIYNILFSSFKSMFSLISKPVFSITPDKIIIQLFYYLLVPNQMKIKNFYISKNKVSK